MGRTMPLVAGTLLAVAAPCRAATLESAADRMLSRLCASIMTLAAEQTEAGDATSGGLLCPSQNPVPHGYHTRAAEAVFPLVLCSLRETNAKRRDALRETALRLGDWLVAQEQPEGFWLETPHSWWGTTAHQLLSLAAARLLLPDNLGEERETRWRTAFRRAGDFLVLRIRADKVPTSYLPTAACALILGSRIVPSDAWEAHAKALIEETVRKVTTDGLSRRGWHGRHRRRDQPGADHSAAGALRDSRRRCQGAPRRARVRSTPRAVPQARRRHRRLLGLPLESMDAFGAASGPTDPSPDSP